MNRFDENFNEIDPITARPFSNGHPDGVWIISFIYGFLLLSSSISILVFLIKLVIGSGFDFALLLGGFVGYLLFLPAIMFLFRRSQKALVWSFGVLCLILISALVGYLFNPATVLGPVIFACVQAYICFYLWGLKSDNLLNGESS